MNPTTVSAGSRCQTATRRVGLGRGLDPLAKTFPARLKPVTVTPIFVHSLAAPSAVGASRDGKPDDGVPRAFGLPRRRSERHTKTPLPALRRTLAAGERDLDRQQRRAAVGPAWVQSIEIIGVHNSRLIEADTHDSEVSAVETLVGGDEIKAPSAAAPWMADTPPATIWCAGI